MLKTRIIPTLLWNGTGLVKGSQFDNWRVVGSLLPAVKVFNLRDVDELILCDIAATHHKRPPDYQEIARCADECIVPLTIGGGICDTATVRQLLLVGADKVNINSAAVTNPDLVTEAASRFGSQSIVVGIDYRRHQDGRLECYTDCGSKPTGNHPADWASELEQRGAGEIVLTSIDRDGTMTGYDLAAIAEVTSAVSIPVVASGGAADYEDFVRALSQSEASAVAAASMFQFTERTPVEARDFLARQGFHVRSTLQG